MLDGDSVPPVHLVPDARQVALHGWQDMCAGRLDEAVACIGLAARLDPFDPVTRIMMGEALLAAFRLAEAEECFTVASRLAPNLHRARTGRWQTRQMRKEDASVEAEMRAAGCLLPVWFRLRGAEPGAMALTIDDGPTPETTPALLDILDRHGVRATFFMLGARAIIHPELVAMVTARGHRIGLHGWSHQAATALSPQSLFIEMRSTEIVLSRFRPTPAQPWVRLPYGLGWDDASVHAALAAWHGGCRIAQWGPTFSEWLTADNHREPGPAFDDACIQSVQRMMAHTDMLTDGIVLVHDKLLGVAGSTAHLAGPRTIDAFLTAARAAGIRVGPLPE